MRQRYKSANCRAASASSAFAKLRSLFSIISSCLSVVGAVATRYKEAIKESIVFMPSVRSYTHHKMRVRLDLRLDHPQRGKYRRRWRDPVRADAFERKSVKSESVLTSAIMSHS